MRTSVREQLGHPEWGVLALPKSSVRWLRLSAVGLIIGGVLGSALVFSMINRQREDLHTATSTPIAQSAEGIQPVPRTSAQPLVVPPMAQERLSPQMTGANARRADSAAPPALADTGNLADNPKVVRTEIPQSEQPPPQPPSASLQYNHQQTSERSNDQKTPKKRELIVPDTGNNTGKTKGVGTIGGPQQPSPYSASASLPDHRQTPERSAIQNSLKQRETIESPSKSHPDETERFFQPWWYDRKITDQRLRNSATPKHAEEPFFRPWWYAQPSVDRYFHHPG